MNKDDQNKYNLMVKMDEEMKQFKKEKGINREILTPKQRKEFMKYVKNKYKRK